MFPVGLVKLLTESGFLGVPKAVLIECCISVQMLDVWVGLTADLFSNHIQLARVLCEILEVLFEAIELVASRFAKYRLLAGNTNGASPGLAL